MDDLATVYLQDDEHSLYRAFITALETRWNVEDEGELTDLLGIEFTRENESIELRQTKYIEKLAGEFFPDGVPPTTQANKVPCDRDLPASSTSRFSIMLPQTLSCFVVIKAFVALCFTLRPTLGLISRSRRVCSVALWVDPLRSCSKPPCVCSVTCTATGTSVYVTMPRVKSSKVSATLIGLSATPPPGSPSTWVRLR